MQAAGGFATTVDGVRQVGPHAHEDGTYQAVAAVVGFLQAVCGHLGRRAHDDAALRLQGRRIAFDGGIQRGKYALQQLEQVAEHVVERVMRAQREPRQGNSFHLLCHIGRFKVIRLV